MADPIQVTEKNPSASAGGAENVSAATDDTATDGIATKQTTLSTGEYLTAILLAVVPTALGGALAVIGAKQNPTVADWTAALEQANDTPAVNTALLEILTSPRYQQIITALRTPQPLLNQDLSPVTYADKDHTPVILDNVATVRGLVWNNADMLSTPWTGGPPHPKGDDLLALVKLLSGYKQSA